ncbi:serine hydrolase domain-containing protein [uncultured Tenacibaculum sp.]|uniref:serine hydrolase domain-containing protein n=1 Tax=uncultured Tenacibaculum sp. TaxID=174713 RepID=UPI0026263912|nr:serine hydrolase domain-containing protein [uncultured Tenacibaculum sp.]
MKTILQFSILIFFTSIFAQSNSSLSTKTINDITNFIKEKKEYYNSPNIAVAITDNNKTIYLKHFGNSQKENKYLIGSNAKSFTALITLILQEKGLLNINEPVNKYLKWFKYKNKNISNKITIKNLLQHTSGISTEMGETFLESDKNFDYTKYYSEILRKIEINDLSEQSYRYSNVNYRLLGLIIENVTNKKFNECLNFYITKPMRLNDTSADINTDLIDSYQYFLYKPILKFNKSFHSQETPSGLISSTANDMAIYLRNLMNSYNSNSNTVLNTNTTKQLFTSNQNNKSGYGFGWRIFNDLFYHSGTNKSFESSMYILPSINKAIIVLINSNQAPDSEIINGIASILLNQKFNKTSSFPYYRSLPLVVFIILIIFLFQIRKWMKLKFPINLSRKIIPNLLLITGISLTSYFLFLFPKLNGVSLKTAIQFDPTSSYSIILIVLLIILTFLLTYFNKNTKIIKI